MQSITIENSLYVGSQNARFFLNDAVRLRFLMVQAFLELFRI